MINTYDFTGGQDAVVGWGQRSVIQFGGTWLPGEWWRIQFVSTEAPLRFTTGLGYLTYDSTSGVGGMLPKPTACFAYQNRVWLAMGKQFNFSAIDQEGPGGDSPRYTQWEEQNAGAGFVLFQSQYGNQDGCHAFSQLQGKLVVFGKMSIQIWSISANPDDFALFQIMDNAGTDALESPQNVGDYDVFYLDRTGVRNVKTHMDTLNSYVDDLGVAVDELVREKLLTFDMASACAVVDPILRSYWVYVGGTIFVLSRFIGPKITAWSTFEPRDSLGTPFAPERFVVFNRQIFCRTVERKFIQYGGADKNTYDGCIMTVELPWLDDNTPKALKMAVGIDAAMQGHWVLRAGMDPESYTQNPLDMETIYESQVTAGTESKDSTFDRLEIPYNQQGTHFKIVAQTKATWDRRARISEILFHYNKTK